MPYHILMVDDDPYFRSEFRELMDDIDVITAKDGEGALSILTKPHSIDLVILDQKMPGMQGTELIKEIEKISPDIPSVLLTGQGNKEVVIEGLRSHATEFIEKPLNPSKIKKIRKLVLSAPKGEKDDSTSGIKGKIEQAKYFAQRNYDKPLTLQDVAGEVCLSPKYLSRLFKEQTGMRFSDYKLQIRMDKAKEILINEGCTIEEISHQLGYRNPESFIKVFRKFNQCTPKQYRDKELKTTKLKDSLKIKVDKLKARNRNLNKEFKNKEEELTEAHEILQKEKHFSGLGRLAATVAHELRHPLGVIQTAAWNIRKKTQSKKIESNLKSIERMVAESEQIINNLLEYSHIKRPVYQDLRIRDLINEVVDTMKMRFEKKPVTITKKVKEISDIRMQTDSVQVKEILTNLFTNAYESIANGKKGKIIIKASIEKNFLIIEMSDNGKGIQDEDKNKIFKPFFSRKRKGTGLGLAITYEIIQIHHGSIDCQSEPGKGTTFIVKLPLKQYNAFIPA